MEAVALEDLPLAQRLREMARKCVERNDEFEKVKAKTKRQEERQAVEKRRQALRQKHADKLAKQQEAQAQAQEAQRTHKRQQAAIRAAKTRAERRRLGLGPMRVYKKPAVAAVCSGSSSS